MDKYIHGFDIVQKLDISIPINGSIIYTDLFNAGKTIPETAKSQRKQINSVMKWLQDRSAPQNMIDLIASTLGSRIDAIWDHADAEMMVNYHGIIYVLKDVKIIDSIEEILKMNNEKLKNNKSKPL